MSFTCWWPGEPACFNHAGPGGVFCPDLFQVHSAANPHIRKTKTIILNKARVVLGKSAFTKTKHQYYAFFLTTFLIQQIVNAAHLVSLNEKISLN